MTNAELVDWVVNIFDADIKGAEAVDSDYVDCVKTQDLRDALSVIRELKAENDRIKQEKLVNVDKLREKLGFAESCEKCKKDSWLCQRDMCFSKMDFCDRLDIAIEELMQEGR